MTPTVKFNPEEADGIMFWIKNLGDLFNDNEVPPRVGSSALLVLAAIVSQRLCLTSDDFVEMARTAWLTGEVFQHSPPQ